MTPAQVHICKQHYSIIIEYLLKAVIRFMLVTDKVMFMVNSESFFYQEVISYRYSSCSCSCCFCWDNRFKKGSVISNRIRMKFGGMFFK